MFILRKKLRKILYKILNLREIIFFGNWRITFSSRRKKIKQFTRDNLKYFSKTFIGNYLLPTKFLVKISRKLESKDQLIIFSLGLGKQITFDEDIRNIFQDKVFLAGFEPSKDCYLFCEDAKIFNFLSNTAIVDTKTYQNYKDKELSLQGSHVIETNLFNKQNQSKRDQTKINFITPALAIEESGVERIDLLKIDIENNTIPVIKDFLNVKFPPSIIVGEIEYYFFNKKKLSIEEYINSLNMFFLELKEKNYSFISTIDERKDSKYHAVEFIAVNEKILDS